MNEEVLTEVADALSPEDTEAIRTLITLEDEGSEESYLKFHRLAVGLDSAGKGPAIRGAYDTYRERAKPSSVD